MSAPPLERLVAALREEAGLLAAAVVDPPADAPTRHGDLAAAGVRGRARPEDYAFLVEAIREGHLLHYGTPRVVRTADADLSLLAGDRLYALGLEVLAALDDLDAVRALADTITGAARAHAEGRPAAAEALWDAGATAAGGGA